MQDRIMTLSGTEFEVLIAKLVSNMGFNAQLTKTSGDGGIDIYASSDAPLFKGNYIIQCKRYAGSVGEPVIRDLYGVVMSERANKGILITTGTFTSSAKSFAEGKQIELIDNNILLELLRRYNIGREAPEDIPFDDFMINSYIQLADINFNHSNTKEIIDDCLFDDLYSHWRSDKRSFTATVELALYLFERATEFEFDNSFSDSEKYSLLESSCCLFNVATRYNGIDKSFMLRWSVCMWTYAKAAFLIGKHSVACDMYKNLLDKWDDLQRSTYVENGLLNLLYVIILDMASFFSATSDYDALNDVLLENEWLLTQKKELLRNGDMKNADVGSPRWQFFKSQLDALENIKTQPCFYLYSHDRQRLFHESSLYDDTTGKFDLQCLSLVPDLLPITKSENGINLLSFCNDVVFAIPN